MDPLKSVWVAENSVIDQILSSIMQFYTWALLSTTPQCRLKKKNLCIFTTYLVFYTKFAHKYSLYVAKRGAKRGRQRGNVVERGFAAFNVVCLVLNEVLCIQRGIMHRSTRLRGFLVNALL